MTPTSIHSTCTCRFFHQGQCSCPDVTLFVIDDDSHAAGPFRLQQDGARMTFFYCLNGQARIDAQAADGEAFSEEIGKGNSLLFCLNGGFSISRAGKRIQAVGLQLRPECLRLFACQLGFVHDGLRKSSSRKPSTICFSQSISFASSNIGGIPIPPPIKNAFFSFFGNPFPSGPVILRIPPVCIPENSSVPFPTLRYTRRMALSFLSISQILIGLGSSLLPSLQYTDTN